MQTVSTQSSLEADGVALSTRGGESVAASLDNVNATEVERLPWWWVDDVLIAYRSIVGSGVGRSVDGTEAMELATDATRRWERFVCSNNLVSAFISCSPHRHPTDTQNKPPN